MPMHRRAFRQAVRHIYSHAITLTEADSRTWDLAVEGVCSSGDTGQNCPPYDRSIQVESLDAVLHVRD